MSRTLLPPNSTAQERAIEGAVARVGEVSVPLRDLWNPQTCPVALLPWLAWALSVDEWESDWPEQIKRNVIAGSMEIHRHKGTPWAVEQALILSGMPFARVEEWFEYAGTPGHFRVVVDIEGQNVSAEAEAKLLRYVESAKRKSAHLDALDYNLSVLSVGPFHVVGLQSSEIITVYPQ